MIKAIVNNGKVEVNIKGEDRAEMLTELAYLNYGALKGMADECDISETKLLKILTTSIEKIIQLRSKDIKIKSHTETEETNIEEALKGAIENLEELLKDKE